MLIDHLKKQGKNLRRLLPAFIAEHPDGGTAVQCLELVAKTHGYPNLHAATQKAETPTKAVKPLAQAIYEDMFGLSAKVNSLLQLDREVLWEKSALALCEAVLPLAIFRESRGQSVDRDFAHFANLVNAVNEEIDAGNLGEWYVFCARRYLIRHCFCEEDGNKLKAGDATFHNFRLTMVPSLRGSLSKASQPSLIEVHHPSNRLGLALIEGSNAWQFSFSMEVDKTLHENDLMVMVNQLIYRDARLVEIKGEHPAVIKVIRLLTAQGITVKVGKNTYVEKPPSEPVMVAETRTKRKILNKVE